MIEYHDQKQLREERFILANGSGGLGFIMARMAWLQVARAAHISLTPQERERTRNGVWLSTLNAYTFSRKGPPPKGFVTSLNRATTNWGPGVELHESMGDMSHSNHRMCLPNDMSVYSTNISSSLPAY